MPLRMPFFRTSKNRWYAWIDGSQRSLGIIGNENEPAAYVAWHRLLSNVSGTPLETPTNAGERIEGRKEGVSLGALLQRYLDDAKQRVAPETYRGYEKYLRFVIVANGKRPATETTTETITEWANDNSWSSSYRHGFLSVLVTAFRWALTKRIIDANPLVGVRKPPKTSRGRKALITPEEHASLIAHADADFADFLTLLWLTGTRPSEIANLTLPDVDFVNAVAILSKHKTLHLGKERLVILNADALAILRRRLPFVQQSNTRLFFVSETGEAMTAKGIGGRMRRTCERAKIRRCIAYGYRHTYATDALSKGVPEATVAALLGHTSTIMLHKHYSHLTSKVAVLREATAKIR